MRPEDEYPYDRNARSYIGRVGVVASINADGRKATVTVPGGSITNVALSEQIPNVAGTVGKHVLVLLDRDAAIAVCTIR